MSSATDGLATIQASLQPLRQQLVRHPVYDQIQNLGDLRLFMEHHVFAVWDFMSLLKALQQRLTCTQVPWVPTADPIARRLINDIVLCEESDESASAGEFASHFEMYLASMHQCGADTSRIEAFLDLIGQGADVAAALTQADVPASAAAFVNHTFGTIQAGSTAAIGAAFTFSREELIPDMFRAIVRDLEARFPDHLSLLRYYLERHIEVDEDRHAPLAMRMLAGLCGNDPAKLAEAERASRSALCARIALWDAVAERFSDARLAGA